MGYCRRKRFFPRIRYPCVDVWNTNGIDEQLLLMKKVAFNFPTSYEDTGAEGDSLWNELMLGKFLEQIFED
jgi:hypothetical protein